MTEYAVALAYLCLPCEHRSEAASRRRVLGAAVDTLHIVALLMDAERASLPPKQLIGHPALIVFDVDVKAVMFETRPSSGCIGRASTRTS
jgi:hypothetical protein